MDSRNALSSKSVHAGASGTALMRLACIVLVSANLAGVSAQRRDAELEAVDDRARRQMVVADAATKVPVRDVLVYTDKGQEARTAWDGSFALPDSFARLTFRHPHYEKRYILSSELRGDTVWLLPNHHALGEVVIWGRRRFDERMSSILKPSPQQEQRDKLPQAIPSGPNVLAMLGWLYDKTLGKRAERRSRRKKALSEMRKREDEYQRKWDMLRDSAACK